MTIIEFAQDGETASRGGVSVKLLPKEYELLRYLARHADRVFGRDELLDELWAETAPTDRTVDDHVYRLRKKCVVWPDVAIETVRGKGYRLRMSAAAGASFPASDELAHRTQALFGDYIRLGRGDALMLLTTQRDLLGFQPNGEQAYFFAFMVGRLAELMDGTAETFPNRVFYLLHYYAFADLAEADRLCALVAEQELATPERLFELRFITPVIFALLGGHRELTYARMAEWERGYAAQPSDNLTPFLHVLRVAIELHFGTFEQAAACIEVAEAVLARLSYLREQGMLSLYAGMLRYAQGETHSASEALAAGWRQLERSRFVPHQLLGAAYMRRFAAREDLPLASAEALRRMASERLETLFGAMRFDAFVPLMRRELRAFVPL